MFFFSYNIFIRSFFEITVRTELILNFFLFDLYRVSFWKGFKEISLSLNTDNTIL